jgi:hypothetical protein
VPEIVLNCAGVLAVVCELVAAGMPQHVTVNVTSSTRKSRAAGGFSSANS